MDLFEDEPKGDDDATGFGVLLNDLLVNELTDFLTNPVHTDAHTTSLVANPEENPEEMFSNESARHISSPPANIQVKDPQPSSLQAKAKKQMQKAKKNIRKINFKRAVTQKFKEYDQKLEALTSINVSEKLYDTLYESIILDQEALDDQNAETSFHKRSHNHQDPPTDREGEKKKRRKDAGQSSSKSSRKYKALMVHAQEDTPADQPQDQEDLYDELTIADLEGAGLEKLKQQYKNNVELEYHIDQLKADVSTEAQRNTGEGNVSKPGSFESHMSKSTKPHLSFYNNDFYYLVSLSTGEKYAITLTKHFAASYADLHILNLNDIEDMYLLKVQEMLHHIELEFEKDFNNALLLFIRRTVIKTRVEDLQLGVESYQITLNLTKPKLYFEGIEDKIPYTMSKTEKGVVYLNQHNRRSLMKFINYVMVL
nr:hypothetical protein [Tanacetum cinerariifolium]